MEFYQLKTESGYMPAGDNDKKMEMKVPVGSYVKTSFFKNRNYLYHKRFFALLRCVFFHKSERFDWIKTEEHLREVLTLTAGYYDLRQNIDFSFYKIPKSISFEKMDQTEFEKYYADVFQVILSVFEFDEQFLNDELLNFM